MTFKKISFLITLLTLSCSDSNQSRYKDTHHLEEPPQIKIVQKPKISEVAVKTDIGDNGLGKGVLLVNVENKAILKIKKNFDHSWEVVDQALKLNEIEITDKDRGQGVFYVTYDPDDQQMGDTSLIDKMTFFMFKDEYDEAEYKLTVVWRESETDITAELVESETNDLLDDGEDTDVDGTTDDGTMLLNALYKTIRDDLSEQ